MITHPRKWDFWVIANYVLEALYVAFIGLMLIIVYHHATAVVHQRVKHSVLINAVVDGTNATINLIGDGGGFKIITPAGNFEVYRGQFVEKPK